MSIQMQAFEYFLFSVIVCIVSSDEIVFTANGPVRGIKVRASNSDVDAFLGIPYAEPPVGELRFKRPVPIRSWNEVYNATQKPYPCYQHSPKEKMYWMPNTENMSEDCLYLNVWVPQMLSDRKAKKKLTVMVWIHGGAFNLGSSDIDIYDGAHLANYGHIIVASINYRIGAFGFLTALIDDANGNMGIYDQILALKWFKQNIAAFGGDPEEIVLFGESAGAMSISLHLVSPLTRNLFKRAILESGSGIHPMSFNSTKRQIATSNRIAKIVGCADNDMNITTHPQRVVDCLKRVSVEDIAHAEGLLKMSNPITLFPRWGDEYMPFDAVHAMKEFEYKNTELLMGFNEDEGALFLTVILPDYFGIYGQNGIDRISKRMAKTIIKGIFQVTEQKSTAEIVDYYIDNVKNQTSSNFRRAIFTALGDYLITCGSIFFSDLYSRNKNSVYFYVFSQRPSSSLLANWTGITHYDEVQYVFGNPMNFRNFTDDEEALSHQIMDRWIAFAKTGNPNIPDKMIWQPYSHEHPVYLNIELGEEMRKYPSNKRCEFWRNRFQATIDAAPDEIAERLIDDPSSPSSSSDKLIMLRIYIGLSLFFVLIMHQPLFNMLIQ